MSFNTEAYGKKGADNLNKGLPLTGRQVQALGSLFCEGKYFGHVQFGLKTGSGFGQAITNSSNSSIPLGVYVFNDSSNYGAAINTSPSSDIVHNFTAVSSAEVFMIQLRSANPGLSVIIDEICISQT